MPHPDNEYTASLPPFHSHTALLISTALPFLQPSYRQPAELIMKFLELSETMKYYREFTTPQITPMKPPSGEESGISAIISHFIQDPEGLLRSLSTVCTGKEKEIINLLLNLTQAKKFYETYGDILSTMMSPDGFSNPFASPPSPTTDETAPEDFSMADMASVLAGGDLSSLLNKEQTDTLNLLKNLLDAE